jgi:5'-methylthioadenosine phosphorylase
LVSKGPFLAIIGGSRAYDLLSGKRFGEKVKTIKPKTPFGKSAPVHLFQGDGYSFYLLSRHGEKGYETTAPFVNYQANIWALKQLGVERIVSWSQPGAINGSMKPGDFIVPHDIIDHTKNRESTFYKGSGLGFIRMGDPFCPEIRSAVTAALLGCDAGVHKEGVYICTEGPRLETPAEIKMFGTWGGDLVGMTLATEAFLAREVEICYGAVCLVSNFAEGVAKREFREGVLFEGMLNDAEKGKVESSVALLPEIAEKTLHRLSRAKRGCACGLAMERYRRNGRIGSDLLKEIGSFKR